MVVRYVSHKALPHSLVAPEGAGGYVELDYVSLHFKMYVFVVSCCTATLDVIQTII